MGKIDTLGVYTLEVLESGLGTTKENEYPQWVVRAKALQKWIDTPEELAHFNLTEPAYVDWSSFNEEISGYLVLFKSASDFNDSTKLLNYEQLQLALGWDGTEFDSLADGTHIGKKFLGRIEENNYNGNTEPRLNWIDAADAPPVRQLRVLEADKVKGLSSKLAGFKKAAPAKPVTATKPGKPSPAASSKAPAASTAASSAAPAAAPAPATAAATPAKPKTPPKVKTPPPSIATPLAPVAGLPTETTQLEAWNYVNENKGGNEDNAIQEAWIAACTEVTGGDEKRTDDTFTPAEWAKVRDIVVKDLVLQVA